MSEYIDIPRSVSEIPAKVSAFLMLKLVKNKGLALHVATILHVHVHVVAMAICTKIYACTWRI